MRSPRYGFIKLLSSQSVITPRGGPSNREAEEPQYQIAIDDYLRVLRESHMAPERAFTLDSLLPGDDGVPAGARNALWDSLPASFRRLMRAMADIQAGRNFDRWWDRLNREELAGVIREFLSIINQMGGDGELGYMLILRYLPEILRRAIQDEEGTLMAHELRIDKPITLYLAEKLGQTASEISAISSSENFPGPPPPGQPAGPNVAPGSVSHGQWLPSMK